jgi:hypothetical protein
LTSIHFVTRLAVATSHAVVGLSPTQESRGHPMGFLDKLKSKISGHEAQLGKGLDKAADLIDDKTGNKHSSQIDGAVDKAKDALGLPDEGGDAKP